MKLKKEHICTLVQIGYHLLFVSGTYVVGSDYLDEIRRTREEVIKQVDKIEKTGNNIKDQLKRVEKACKF